MGRLDGDAMSYTEDDLCNLLRESTVRIETPDGHGTGFFAGRSLLLTARHVVCHGQECFAPDVLKIFRNKTAIRAVGVQVSPDPGPDLALIHLAELGNDPDRKSTRLNSSHLGIS